MNEVQLNRHEQESCEKIALSAEGLASQRATALLVLASGASKAEAARKSGLTTGQLRYLLTAFADKRLNIFPEGVLPLQASEEIANADEQPESATPSEDEHETPLKKTKKKRKKSDNASKKDKKKKKKAKKKDGKKGKKKKKK